MSLIREPLLIERMPPLMGRGQKARQRLAFDNAGCNPIVTRAEGDRKGPVGPPSSNHNDCILDLKVLNVQSNQNRPLLLSAGRDGVVKVWR